MQSRTPIPTVEDIRLIIKPSVGNRITDCDLEELIDLISDLMEIKLFDKQMLKVKALQKYLGDDIKIFSPNEERKTILELIQYKHELFNQKLSDYNSINRENGEFLLPY